MLLGLLGILIAIIFVIFSTKKGLPLGISMLCASLIVAIFNAIHPIMVVQITWGAVTSISNITLVLIVIAITAFGYILRETGSLQEIIKDLQNLINDIRILLMVVPALVGLLMVPGGAVFSAPMIEEMGDSVDMDRDTLSSVNNYYRHMLFLIFPFYPGMLIASELTGIEIGYFVRFNIPILILGTLLSYFYFFHNIKVEKSQNSFEFIYLYNLFNSMLPFFMVLVLGLGFGVYFPLALLVGIIYVVVRGNPRDKSDQIKAIERIKMPWKGISWSMALAILSIMIFKDFVQATGALGEFSLLLIEQGIPIMLLVVCMSLLTGFFSGNQTAALGMTLPVFLPILPQGLEVAPIMAVIFICTLMGYLASPFHLCLVLTVEYFQASLAKVIKKVAIACGIIVALSLLQLFLIG